MFTKTDSVKQGLLAAYRSFMRPLVRILIRHGISFNEFADVLKAVFAEVADEDFSLPGKKQSQSRIAILTGLTRKEVAKLKSTDYGRDEGEKRDVHRVARVLVGWHQDPEYTGPYGVPYEIPFEAADHSPSFSELVRRYSGDMAPRAMLDELQRVGAIEEIDNGWFRVMMRSYIPETLAPEALERLATVVENFITTVEVNLKKERPGAGRFERIVLSDNGLSPKQMEEFDKLIREKGQQLLEELDDWLSSQEEPEEREKVMTGVGIYHFIQGDRAVTTIENSKDSSSN